MKKKSKLKGCKYIVAVLFICSFFFLTKQSIFSQTWQPVGTGANNYTVNLLNDTSSDNLIIAGWFTQSGGNSTPFVSSFNGSTYSSMESGFNSVTGDLELYNNDIYIAGSFTMAGTDSIECIARWNTDSNSWEPVVNSIDGGISDMEVYNGYLYISGNFTTINGLPMYYTAKFDGTNWTATALSVPSSTMYVGDLENDGTGGLYYLVQRDPGYDNQLRFYNGFFSSYIPTWADLNLGCLKYLDNILYIGCPTDPTPGYFDYIYTWDGSSFSDYNYLPANVNSSINQITSGVSFLGEKDGHLVVGGKPLTPSAPGVLFEAVGGNFEVLAFGNNGSYFYDIEKYQNYYYTVGTFISIDGTPANRIARLYYPPPNANFNLATVNACVGSPEHFNNTSSYSTSYIWSFPGGIPSTSTATNPNVTYNVSGDYDVTLIATSTYGSDTLIMNDYVHVHDLPADPTITYTYPYLTSSYPVSNQWYLNGIIIAGATSQNYNPVSNGSYTVRYTGSYSCQSFSDPFIFSSMGITSEDIDKNISIYPNPFINCITIDGIVPNTEIKLYNTLGEITGNWIASENNYTINTENIPAGIYLLNVGNTTRKIIKQ